MQTETVTREDWHRTVGALADNLLAKEGPDSVTTRALLFEANPKAKRVVFIATPHKGADMAVQTIGDLATHLIRLPISLAGTLSDALGDEVAEITGNAKTLPDSVSSLSPEPRKKWCRRVTRSSEIAANPDRLRRARTAWCRIGARTFPMRSPR
jgi:hypothetical protein